MKYLHWEKCWDLLLWAVKLVSFDSGRRQTGKSWKVMMIRLVDDSNSEVGLSWTCVMFPTCFLPVWSDEVFLFHVPFPTFLHFPPKHPFSCTTNTGEHNSADTCHLLTPKVYSVCSHELLSELNLNLFIIMQLSVPHIQIYNTCWWSLFLWGNNYISSVLGFKAVRAATRLWDRVPPASGEGVNVNTVEFHVLAW